MWQHIYRSFDSEPRGIESDDGVKWRERSITLWKLRSNWRNAKFMLLPLPNLNRWRRNNIHFIRCYARVNNYNLFVICILDGLVIWNLFTDSMVAERDLPDISYAQNDGMWIKVLRFCELTIFIVLKFGGCPSGVFAFTDREFLWEELLMRIV